MSVDINLLPQDVQDKVRETLTAYPVAYVEYENGEYTYIAGLCLDTRVKAPDFTTHEFKNTDIYTKDEIAEHIRVLNSYARNVPDSFWN